MTSYLDLPIGDKTTQLITAVIEIRRITYRSFKLRVAAIGRNTPRLRAFLLMV